MNIAESLFKSKLLLYSYVTPLGHNGTWRLFALNCGPAPAQFPIPVKVYVYCIVPSVFFFMLSSNSILRILLGNDVVPAAHKIAEERPKESELRKLMTAALLLMRSP
jgi:hypothetical protein